MRSSFSGQLQSCCFLGALQCLLAAVRAVGANPEIQDEAQKVIPLLMDEDEADEIAKRCIKAINAALGNPQNLLAAFKETSAAAASPLVAKALSKHLIGELVAKAMADQNVMDSKEGFEIKKEIMTVRPVVHANIEWQVLSMSASSTAGASKLRSAGLFEAVCATLPEMVAADDPAGITATLGAGRRLLGSASDRDVAEKHDLVVNICRTAGDHLSNPLLVKNAGLFLLALGQREDTRGLLSDPEVMKILQGAADKMTKTNNLEERKSLCALIGGVLACKNPEMSKIMLNHDGLLPACLEVLEADKEGDAGNGALAILDGLGASDALRPKWNKVNKFLRFSVASGHGR